MKRLLCLVVLIAGCRTAPPIVTRVESDPPGARIFVSFGADIMAGSTVGREYVGAAPCDYTCPQDSGDLDIPKSLLERLSPTPPLVVFYAEPASGTTNLFPKHQVFHGKGAFVPADAVPKGVFFDLTKP